MFQFTDKITYAKFCPRNSFINVLNIIYKSSPKCMIRVKERALESAVCFCKPFDLTLKAVLCQTEVEYGKAT